MTIGLPLIGATSKCTDLSSDEGENYHVVRLSDIVSLKVFTSDDMNLETGGSVWHAGKILKPALKKHHLKQWSIPLIPTMMIIFVHH